MAKPWAFLGTSSEPIGEGEGVVPGCPFPCTAIHSGDSCVCAIFGTKFRCKGEGGSITKELVDLVDHSDDVRA